MYTFVRIHRKNSDEYGCWYLKPNSSEQVEEHYRKICGRVIKDGVHNYLDKVYVDDNGKYQRGHTTDAFSTLVNMELDFRGGTFFERALEIENLAFKTRMDSFAKGIEIYLPESMIVYCMPSTCEIVETVKKDELEYPSKNNWTMDDVRYMQWGLIDNKGEHWYAKIGNRDVVDKNGNMKWNTKAEAERAAEWFIEKHKNK